MKYIVTAFAIVMVSFVSSAVFYRFLNPIIENQEILIIKKGDRIVVFENGKYVTYYGKITKENSKFVQVKAELRLEGVK